MTVDLDAYFRRIQYSGERVPTLQTLHALCERHVREIPFENLDVLLGRGIDLSDEAVDAKILGAHRGGYCFEQNTLFLRVLLALGYAVTPISARVRVQRARDFTPPRSHVFLRVEIDGTSWLADVGVGGLSPTCALRLALDVEQPTPHETRRLIQEGARYFHQAKLDDVWSDVCEFTLEEMPPIDREVANWFTSTHPQSHFKNRLMVARALDDGARLTLLNRQLTLRRGDGTTERSELDSDEALLEVLRERFQLHFEGDTRFVW